MKLAILREMHNVTYAGHPGYQKTMATVKSQYFWLGMKREIIEYISRCMEFQKVKAEHRLKRESSLNTSLDVWSARKLKMSIGTQQGCCNLYPFLSGSGKQ